jgi:hypothetical protein
MAQPPKVNNPAATNGIPRFAVCMKYLLLDKSRPAAYRQSAAR